MHSSSEKSASSLSKVKKIPKSMPLVYATEEQLCIERHKKGTGFYYTNHGHKISNKKRLERFKNLVIPPAWTAVKICSSKNGHVQVVGRDAKNRKVYRYHPLWTTLQNQTKFVRMATFGKNLPKIRTQVAKDLKRPGMSQRKVLALVLLLMEETHIRIGNQYYADENESFGLTTLRAKHVDFYSDKLKFEFIGKKGKAQTITVKDEKLIKLVSQCEEIPGWELFHYYDETSAKKSIDSGMVNEYIRGITNTDFSAKDFRTWAGTKLFFEALLELGYVKEENMNKHNRVSAYRETAKSLGNTKTVCENYYVHSEIPKQYKNGEIEKQFKKVQKTTAGKYFSKTEKIILKMIENYEVEIGS